MASSKQNLQTSTQQNNQMQKILTSFQRQSSTSQGGGAHTSFDNTQTKISPLQQQQTSLPPPLNINGSGSSGLGLGQVSSQDLSNRSNILMQNPQAFVPNNQSQQWMTQQQYMQDNNNNKYFSSNLNNSAINNQNFSSIILSAGSVMNPRNGQACLNYSTADPYSYLRQQQQKYNSCRSMLYNKKCNSNPYYKQYQKMNTNQQFAKKMKAKQSDDIHGGSNGFNQNQFNQEGMSGGGGGGNGQTLQKQKNYARSCSSTESVLNTSSTTIFGKVNSLSEVKNPQFFIQFRFTDRKALAIPEIRLFKNLTQLDLSGNLLKNEIPELNELNFLKKLNLSNNQISEMYQVPVNVETLNLSYNLIVTLNKDVTATLKSLVTLDLSHNNLTNLSGVQNLKRLKRLLCKSNQITSLEPLQGEIQENQKNQSDSNMNSLVEIDIENNPVENFDQILAVVAGKKDLLVYNIKQTPLIITISNYDQLVNELALNTNSKLKPALDYLKLKLRFFQSGILYRNKRVHQKLRSLQQHSKRSSSNFSNESSSYRRVNGCAQGVPGIGGFNLTQCAQTTTLHNQQKQMDYLLNEQVKLHGTSAAGMSPLLGNLSNNTPNQHQHHNSQRNEEIEVIYDEILDEEEEFERKQMRIKRKKNLKEKKRLVALNSNNPNEESKVQQSQDQALQNQLEVDEFEDDYSYEDDEEDDGEEEDEDDYIHQTLSGEEDFEDFQTHINQQNQKVERVERIDRREILNESTADFNKEIRLINQEIREQFGEEGVGNIAEFTNGMTSLQSTQTLNTNQKKKIPISFKLDLSKCKQQQDYLLDSSSAAIGPNHNESISQLVMGVTADIDLFQENGVTSNIQSVKNSKKQGGHPKLREDEDVHFDIPGLQFVKVTDDSFRQIKMQSNAQSKRTQRNQEDTLRLNKAGKNGQKPILVPKLQLGALQKNIQASQNSNALLQLAPLPAYALLQEGSFQNSKNEIQMPVFVNTSSQPLQDTSNGSLITIQATNQSSLSAHCPVNKSSRSEFSKPTNSNDLIQKSSSVSQSCMNQSCVKMRDELKMLQELQKVKDKQVNEELERLKTVMLQIKSLLEFEECQTLKNVDFESVPRRIEMLVESEQKLLEDKHKLGLLIEELQTRCRDLDQLKQHSSDSLIKERQQSQFQQNCLESKLQLQDKQIEDLTKELLLKQKKVNEHSHIKEHYIRNPNSFKSDSAIKDRSKINRQDDERRLHYIYEDNKSSQQDSPQKQQVTSNEMHKASIISKTFSQKLHEIENQDDCEDLVEGKSINLTMIYNNQHIEKIYNTNQNIIQQQQPQSQLQFYPKEQSLQILSLEEEDANSQEINCRQRNAGDGLRLQINSLDKRDLGSNTQLVYHNIANGRDKGSSSSKNTRVQNESVLSKDHAYDRVDTQFQRTRGKRLAGQNQQTKRPQSVAHCGSSKYQGGRHRIFLQLNETVNPTDQSSCSNLTAKQQIMPSSNSHYPHHNFTNEYDNILSAKSEKAKLSQTMNKKVGVYIEKLKERNSSLQERLNISINTNNQMSTSNYRSVILNNQAQQQSAAGNGKQCNKPSNLSIQYLQNKAISQNNNEYGQGPKEIASILKHASFTSRIGTSNKIVGLGQFNIVNQKNI